MSLPIGKRIIQLRNAAGLSQEALGAAWGVSQSTVQRYEKGQGKKAEIPRDELVRIASALGADLAGLVGGTDHAHLNPEGGVPRFVDANGKSRSVYFASALTGLDEAQKTRILADAAIVREVCQELRLYLYEPCQYTDPVKDEHIPAEEVYRIDRLHVSDAVVMVLDARFPSFGAGQEVEIATQYGVPIVLLWPDGVSVTRMVRGCHARLFEVRFSTDEELQANFRSRLGEAVNDRLPILKGRALSIGDRVAKLRTSRGYGHGAVAQAVGISETAIRAAEADPTDSSLSVVHLARLAELYEESLSYVVDGHRPGEMDENLVKASRALDHYALEINLGHATTRALWEEYKTEYELSRAHVAEARTDMTPAEWQSRHQAYLARQGTGEASQGKAATPQSSLFGDDDDED